MGIRDTNYQDIVMDEQSGDYINKSTGYTVPLNLLPKDINISSSSYGIGSGMGGSTDKSSPESSMNQPDLITKIKNNYTGARLQANLAPYKDKPYTTGIGETAQDVGPMIASAGATALLGPEASYPVYMATSAATQGVARGLLNKLNGKDFFNKDTAIDTGLGLIGGFAQKPTTQLGEMVSKPIFKAFAQKGLSPDTKELVNGILNKSEELGPEVRSTLDDAHSAETEGVPNEKGGYDHYVDDGGKEANNIKNLYNKNPQEIKRNNTNSPTLMDLQQEVIDALNKNRSYSAGSTVAGRTAGALGNMGGQRAVGKMGQMLLDKINQGTQKVKETFLPQ